MITSIDRDTSEHPRIASPSFTNFLGQMPSDDVTRWDLLCRLLLNDYQMGHR